MPDTSEPLPQPTRWRSLPLLSELGRRSPLTCQYRCANACAHQPPNRSDSPYFGDIVAASITRRRLLQAGAVTALVVSTGAALRPEPARGSGAAAGATAGGPPGALTFDPVEPNTVDSVIVANGYEWEPLVVWGDPVTPDAPRFDLHHQTATAQRRQFGYNNDFLALLPFPGDDNRALLVANHEYTDEQLMFPNWHGGLAAPLEQLRVAMAAHGLSVVELRRVGDTGEWRLLRSGARRYNRRVHMWTACRLTGPAAGHRLLRTKDHPAGRWVNGTLNNCAGGVTPWGTTLHGEENFNGYFVGSPEDAPAEQRAAFERYTIGVDPASESNRAWDRVDPRFNIKQEPNEANRFGWIVELDPFDPDYHPHKRTMLGRFKHEGATIRLAQDGRVVVYMGDDERFEYVYKFVSAKSMMPGDTARARDHNRTLLDTGTLYVAKFIGDSPREEWAPDPNVPGDTIDFPADGLFDGVGEWLPLASDTRSYVPGFSVAEVLIWTRLAADKVKETQPDGVGATRMDRPEDIEPNPVTGRVYGAFTNNTARTAAEVDEANPRPENRHGHVIEWQERDSDPAATRFRWRIFILAGDPAAADTYYGGYDKSQVSPISSPDNVAFDRAGNLWLTTDGNALGVNDGLFGVPTRGAERGHAKLFLTVPVGAECTGPVISPDQRTLLAAAQHPGETTGSTFEHPSSTFPYGNVPRPTVVVVWRTAPGSKRIGG